MDCAISIQAVPGGWTLRCDGLAELMFLSGAKAEARASDLALAHAAVGRDTRIEIHDRAGRLVSTRRFFAETLVDA